MGLELGTQAWLDELRSRLNDSGEYRETAAGWDWPLGLGFLAEDGVPTRLAWLDIHQGRCREATLVDEERFEEAPFALSGRYSAWHQVAEGGIEPMKAIVLRRIEFRGNTLKAMKHLPAAKILVTCACDIPTDVPV